MMKNNTLKTGFQSIDVSIGGFLPGELILIGGRPAMGTSAFALDVLLNNRDGKTLVYLQTEDPQIRTLEKIKRKTSNLDLSVEVTEVDLAPQFTEVKVASSEHILCHLEEPNHLEVFETLTLIAKNRTIDGIIIDSGTSIKPYVLGFNKRKETYRFFKSIAKAFELPVFVVSSISRKVELGGDFETEIWRYGSRIPIVDMALILFRWSYYSLDEDAAGESVSESDAMIAIPKSKRSIREYQPRLQFDWSTLTFTTATNHWYDYLENNPRINAQSISD